MIRSAFSRLILVLTAAVSAAVAQPLTLTPLHPSGIYELGAPAGWTVVAKETVAASASYSYTLKKDNAVVVSAGKLDLSRGAARIEATLEAPAMLYLEITSGRPDEKPVVAGAAVAPTELKPVVDRPADFDSFWSEKIKQLQKIPADPVLTPAPSGRDGVEYATIKMKNIHGHVYGQIARPAGDGRYPAILMLQWAGGPYPLERAWVVDRAAEGWLVLNVEPHDVPGDLPKEFYAALPQLIKEYTTIYNDDRERNYFLRMYLGDYRALDYLVSHPNWNGKILVAMGTSMGGQQSFAVAGLHPRVTHMITHVAAGADSNAELHGRHAGYPNWDLNRPNVAKTALYFDIVNFAPNIRAKSLVSMGFLDNVCPPAGLWTAYNLIPGPKEVVPLPEAAHNHESTPEQQKAYTDRSNAWLKALVSGQEPELPGR